METKLNYTYFSSKKVNQGQNKNRARRQRFEKYQRES
jgi:hypothetical protein